MAKETDEHLSREFYLLLQADLEAMANTDPAIRAARLKVDLVVAACLGRWGLFVGLLDEVLRSIAEDAG